MAKAKFDCKDNKTKIDDKETQLSSWQARKEALLNDPASDLKEMRTVLDTIESLDKELIALRTERRQNRCEPDDQVPLDNQIILSTSSVRRRLSI